MKPFGNLPVQSVTLALALSAASISGYSTSTHAADAPAPPKAYVEHCAVCHGAGGEGGTGPRIIGPGWQHGGDDESMTTSIQRGFPQSGMPPFDAILKADEIKAVIAFLRAQMRASPVPVGWAPGIGDKANIPEGVAKSAVESFRVESIAMLKLPYGMAFLPDGRLLVTESREGTLRIVENGKLLPEPVIGTPLGEPPRDHFRRRMLDVAVHPSNGWIYLSTSEGADGPPGITGRITLSRGHIRDGHWVDSEVLLELPSPEGSGARIAFDKQGRVYFSTVHAPSGEDIPLEQTGPQDLASPHGKILRLMDDGSVPADNPFVDNKEANPYVWSYGLRSPLGLSVDNQDRLWVAEQGPRGGDELNLILPGRNYGWPVITWGHPYDSKPNSSNTNHPKMEQPVVSWVPSPALSGTAFYDADAFPRWKNSLFVASLKQKTLYRITFDGDMANLQEIILSNLDRIRDVEVGPDGYLYLINDNSGLLRLVPAS